MQLDEVSSWIVEKRLEVCAHGGRVAHLDVACAELADAGVEVGDENGEVLAVAGGHLAFDEMDLLPAGVEPGATKTEVRPVGSSAQPENVDIEVERGIDVVHIDRHVVHCERFHSGKITSR